jgi:hypothetical protein
VEESRRERDGRPHGVSQSRNALSVLQIADCKLEKSEI